MTGPPPATAAVRLAVRRAIGDERVVHAAVSGGADSLALAAGLAFERPGAGAVVVDHGLQPGSDQVARRAAEQCEQLGLAAQVLTAKPDLASQGGPEATARRSRYALLDDLDGLVLLGHTRDDQAESVLLGLVRGSGARALAGMPAARGHYRRPLLDLSRETTRKACAEAGLTPWEDPHNDDPSYQRIKVRQLLAGLDLTDGLVRSARLLREDADALDALARPEAGVAELLALPGALRSRGLKLWAEQACGRPVTLAQVDALRALVEDWHGQGAVALPGGGRVHRVDGRLAFAP